MEPPSDEVATPGEGMQTPGVSSSAAALTARSYTTPPWVQEQHNARINLSIHIPPGAPGARAVRAAPALVAALRRNVEGDVTPAPPSGRSRVSASDSSGERQSLESQLSERDIQRISDIQRRVAFSSPEDTPVKLPDTPVVYVPTKRLEGTTPAQAKTAVLSIASKYSEATDRESCSICLKELPRWQSGVAFTGCGHAYHIECYGEWAVRGNEACPLCREPLDFKKCMGLTPVRDISQESAASPDELPGSAATSTSRTGVSAITESPAEPCREQAPPGDNQAELNEAAPSAAVTPAAAPTAADHASVAPTDHALADADAELGTAYNTSSGADGNQARHAGTAGGDEGRGDGDGAHPNGGIQDENLSETHLLQMSYRELQQVRQPKEECHYHPHLTNPAPGPRETAH